MADFSIAAQVGQNAMAPQGQSNMLNPMNMLQMQQTMQTIALQRAAEARAQEQFGLTRRSTEQSMGITAAAEERAKATHGVSLASSQMDLAAKREQKELSDLYFKTKGERGDNLFDPDFMKETQSKNSKLYELLKKDFDSQTALKIERDRAKAEGRGKTIEVQQKELAHAKNIAPILLPALDNPNLDEQSFFKIYDDLARTSDSLSAAIPRKLTPENVAKLKQALTGIQEISVVDAGDTKLVRRGNVFIGELDPLAPGGTSLFPQPIPVPGAAQPAAPAGASAGQPAGPAPANAMATGMLRQFEGFRDKPYWDVDAHRGGYGSDTVTTADGRVVRVQPGMTISRQDAERDLARRTGESASRAAAQAGQAWASLPPNAQTALTSIAYNYGSLPERILGAVRSGNSEVIARAVEELAGDNNGVNFNRRMQEAAVIRGGAAPATTASPLLNAQPNAPQMMAANAMAPQMMAANAMAPQMAQPQNAMAAPAPAPVIPTPAPMPVTQQPSNLPPEPRREQYATVAEFNRARKNWDELAKADRARRERLEDEATKRDAELAKAKELKKFETGLKPGVEEKAAEVRATTRAKADVERELEGEKDVSNTAKTLSEIRGILVPGGLLERSTGSGLGRLVDATTGFFGYATEGAKAAAALKPIADIALKQVPRFEGPQSDADRQSYVEASGAVADASLPNEVRRAALQTMERLLVKHQKYLAEKGRGQPPETYQYYEGQTATDPKTGARVVFQNNQWGPLK